VLMDISMPRMNGIEAARMLHQELPDIRVIGLSVSDRSDQIAAMREAGAVNYLAKSAPSEMLIDAIRQSVPHSTSARNSSYAQGKPGKAKADSRKSTKIRS